MVWVGSGDQNPVVIECLWTRTHTHTKLQPSTTTPVREMLLVADLTGLDAGNCGAVADVRWQVSPLGEISVRAEGVK